MKQEYVIINKTELLKEIEELENYKDEPEVTQLKIYKKILSQSIPLIPELEKAILEGVNSINFENDGSHWTNETVVEDYISNLKLNI